MPRHRLVTAPCPRRPFLAGTTHVLPAVSSRRPPRRVTGPDDVRSADGAAGNATGSEAPAGTSPWLPRDSSTSSSWIAFTFPHRGIDDGHGVPVFVEALLVGERVQQVAAATSDAACCALESIRRLVFVGSAQLLAVGAVGPILLVGVFGPVGLFGSGGHRFAPRCSTRSLLRIADRVLAEKILMPDSLV